MAMDADEPPGDPDHDVTDYPFAGVGEGPYDPGTHLRSEPGGRDGTLTVGMGGFGYITEETADALGVSRLETAGVGECLAMVFYGDATAMYHVYPPTDELDGASNDIGTIAEDVLETVDERTDWSFERAALMTATAHRDDEAVGAVRSAMETYADEVGVFEADSSAIGVEFGSPADGYPFYEPTDDVEVTTAPRGMRAMDAPGGAILEDETAALARRRGVDVPTVGDVVREGREPDSLVGTFDPGVGDHDEKYRRSGRW